MKVQFFLCRLPFLYFFECVFKKYFIQSINLEGLKIDGFGQDSQQKYLYHHTIFLPRISVTQVFFYCIFSTQSFFSVVFLNLVFFYCRFSQPSFFYCRFSLYSFFECVIKKNFILSIILEGLKIDNIGMKPFLYVKSFLPPHEMTFRFYFVTPLLHVFQENEQIFFIFIQSIFIYLRILEKNRHMVFSFFLFFNFLFKNFFLLFYLPTHFPER